MKHETNKEAELIVEETSENFNSWLAREFISPGLRKKLSDVDILIIPYEKFRDEEYNPFPVNTDVLLHFIKQALHSEYRIDLCIEDLDYCEVSIDSRIRRIGNFIVSSVVLVLFLDILGNYIYDKIEDKNIGTVSLTVAVFSL